MIVSCKTFIRKKWLIFGVIIVLAAFLTSYIECAVKVCDVVYDTAPEEVYERMVKENPDNDVSLIIEQVTTGGTEFKLLQSTNDSLTEGGDIIITGWINPSFLSENNDFYMQSIVKYVILSEKGQISQSEAFDDKTLVPSVKAAKTIMITPDENIFNSAKNGSFKAKDLSAYGHIRLYLSPFVPLFRCSA